MSLKKIYIFIAFSLFSYPVAFAQPYGNEWIDFGKTYYKVPVAATGIYRISYDDMQTAGIQVAQINHQKYQLYLRGKEQAIRVDLGNDNVFNTGDFLEFYGLKNDGTQDTAVYKPVLAQPHKYYNLFSDTAAYFLTWSVGPENGKRMSTFYSNNQGNIPKEAYHTEEKLLLYTSDYSPGLIYSAESYMSYYDFGEGWTGPKFATFSDISLNNITEVNNAGPPPNLDILLAGRNGILKTIQLQVNNVPVGQSININGYLNGKINQTLSFNDIVNPGKIDLKLVTNTSVSVSYVRLTYPQNFQMSGLNSKNFNLLPNPQNTSYIEILNPPAGAVIYNITNPDVVSVINYDLEPGKLKAIIPGTSEPVKLLVAAPLEAKNVVLKPSVFQQLNLTNENYIIISHALLRKPSVLYSDPVKAYADYRASVQGGSYDTLVLNIDQIYDQFGYGEPTPYAITRFSRYLKDKANPELLFLLGKGLPPNWRTLPDIYKTQNLIPTFGYPGSDLMFTALLGNGTEPEIPVGRLNAKSPQDVESYLEKVKEQESTPYDELWRKSILHLSGGSNDAEQITFKSYLKNYEDIAEAPYFGANVTTVLKGNNAPTVKINIAEQVNKGVSLITFFGHSAGEVIEVDIGKVSDPVEGYNNKGKYPLIYVNGCNIGDYFAPDQTLAENWVLTPKKGATLFLGHSHLGFPDRLNNYAKKFYETAYTNPNYYGKPVGKIQKEVVNQYMAIPGYANSPISIAGAQQINLLGDPALKLFAAPLPDYAVKSEELFLQSYNQKPVNALADTFSLKIPVYNFGKSYGDTIPLGIKVKRTYPDGKVFTYGPTQFPQVLYKDTLEFKIFGNGNQSFGLNKFEVFVDNDNSIQELREDNNYGVLNYFLPLSGIRALFPVNYSIVSNNNVTLMAQPTNTSIGLKNYFFELDTINLFNSNIKKDTVLLNSGILPSWNTTLPLDTDSLVYYWRARFKDYAPGEDTLYGSGSFIYIKNGPFGWSQSHFPQFSEADLTDVLRNEKDRKWEFSDIESTLKVRTFGGADLMNNYDSVYLFIDGVPEIYYGNCGPKPGPGINRPENSIYAVGFEANTLKPYKIIPSDPINPPFTFDHWRWSCGKLYAANTLGDLDIQFNNWLKVLIDSVKTGDYVLLISAGNLKYSAWPAETKNKLSEIGADPINIAALSDGYPYIMLGRKGAVPGQAKELVGINDMQKLETEFTLKYQPSKGYINSSLIGPSVGWDTVYHEFKKTHPDQKYKLELIGVDLQGKETMLKTIGNTPFAVDDIDHKLYPYFRLRAEVEDPTPIRVPPQLAMWRIIYKGVPEGLASFVSDPTIADKQEGQKFQVPVKFINVSNLNFPEKIILKTSLINDKTGTSFRYDTLSTLAAGETLPFAVPVDTKGKSGSNKLQVYFNPELQPEQYYSNNILEFPFKVLKDSINPVLDVVFDGIRIMDGDIVSATPVIGINLRDENKFLLKSDTTGMELFLKRPCQNCEFEKVDLNSPEISWTPAGQDNVFRMEYKPKKLTDGTYTLRVQGTDESENKSGKYAYEVRFEVVGETTVTHFYPYPNPFSTRTRFVFTLTGAEIPDRIKIQIMTVTGKVVREITQDELGPIHIGNNITEFAWDGTDEYGDRLANGVYLYRVLMNNKGEAVKRRSTSADKSFKKEFGKVVILR